jgi:hypothetical protein
MDFPQYRKRFDNKSFYKIINERSMQEVQIVGEKQFIYDIKADKYFEILRIQEILDKKNAIYQVITESEFNSI